MGLVVMNYGSGSFADNLFRAARDDGYRGGHRD